MVRALLAAAPLLLAGCPKREVVSAPPVDPRQAIVERVVAELAVPTYPRVPVGVITVAKDVFGPLDYIDFTVECSSCGIDSAVGAFPVGAAEVDPPISIAGAATPDVAVIDGAPPGSLVDGRFTGRVQNPGPGAWELWLMHDDDALGFARNTLEVYHADLDFTGVEPGLAVDGSGRVADEALLARAPFSVSTDWPGGMVFTERSAYAFGDDVRVTVRCGACTDESWIGLFRSDGLTHPVRWEPSDALWRGLVGTGDSAHTFQIYVEDGVYELRLYYGSGMGGLLDRTSLQVGGGVAASDAAAGPSADEEQVAAVLTKLLGEWRYFDEVVAVAQEAYARYVGSGFTDATALDVADRMADKVDHNYGWTRIHLPGLRGSWERGTCSTDVFATLDTALRDGQFHARQAQAQVPPVSGLGVWDAKDSLAQARVHGATVYQQLQQLHAATPGCFQGEGWRRNLE